MNTEMPDAIIKPMSMVIRTSGSRGRSVQPVRSCYALGLESPKRQRTPYSQSLGFNTPSTDTFSESFSDTVSEVSSDKKSVHKALGKFFMRELDQP
jgi:hypothetical protein